MASCAPSSRLPVAGYPLARRDESTVDVLHGKQVPDPYRWLEDPDAPETKEYVQKLNQVCDPFLEACPVRDKMQKRMTELWDFPKFGCSRKHGDHYFYFHNSGLQNQSVLYIQDDPTAEGKMFLDPNTFSDDGTVAISQTAFSKDGSILAYGVSERGSDWESLKFMKVPSGEKIDDILTGVKHSCVAWTIDKSGIFYSRYPHHKNATVGTTTEKNEFHSLFFHKMGTDQKDDVLVYNVPDQPDYMVSAEISEDGTLVFMSIDKGCDPTNLLYYYRMTPDCQVTDRLDFKPLVSDFEARYEFIDNDGSQVLLLTNLDAPMFKLVRVDLNKPEKENWVTVIEESSDCKLDWAAVVAGDKLLLCYMEHVKIFYAFTSFFVPTTIYRYDFKQDSGIPTVLHAPVVKGLDASLFTVKQAFYSSKDGTKVPMYIVHKKDLALNGSNPTILYGYGGYNIAMLPYFSVHRYLFLRHFDGVYCVANLRGGSEYGEKWHEAAMLEKKQNVFDDFIAAAEFLIENKYTQPSKLCIEGASNGGTLVAACANQRPELFGALINQVGVLDMLRFHKFTIGGAWIPEFGDPGKEEHFKFLYEYSPLHNLKKPSSGHQFPAMYLNTADHDDRVVPLHSLKYMAQLYHTVHDCSHQQNPLVIKVDVKAGHGHGKPTKKIIEELVDKYSFVARVFDMQFKE